MNSMDQETMSLLHGYEDRAKSLVGKKIAAVDFTTMPYEPCRAHKVQGKSFCPIFVLVLVKLSLLGLKI